MSNVNDIFIITSVINTGDKSWSYFHKRSLFSSQERFNQTIDTIKSVKKYSPDSKIILVEGGILEKDKLDYFMSNCDYLYYIGEDTETQNNCIKSNCKGLGDSWLISKGLQYIKDNNIIGRNIYKISGRYIINENFNINNISNDLPTFKNAIDNVYITFFYSVPYSLFDKYVNNINRVIEVMKVRNDISLEVILPSLFKNKHIIDIIGAEGIIAVDESISVYKV